MVSGDLHKQHIFKDKTNIQSETLKNQFQGFKIPVSTVDGNVISTCRSEQNKNTFQQPESPK